MADNATINAGGRPAEVADLMENRVESSPRFAGNVPNETRFVSTSKNTRPENSQGFQWSKGLRPFHLDCRSLTDTERCDLHPIWGPSGPSTMLANGESVTSEISAGRHSNSAALYSSDWNLNSPPQGSRSQWTVDCRARSGDGISKDVSPERRV
jgi:hypothetical protein